MIVRQLTIDECQAVADLEIQLFDGRFNAADLRAMLGKPAFYGAVLTAADLPMTINAYCLVHITSMQLDVIAIGTEKTKRGQGFGRIILQHLITVADQLNVVEITLEVAVDNMLARHLYESCGFRVSAVRKNYYRRCEHRCDALIMVRRLDTAFP